MIAVWQKVMTKNTQEIQDRGRESIKGSGRMWNMKFSFYFSNGDIV